MSLLQIFYAGKIPNCFIITLIVFMIVISSAVAAPDGGTLRIGYPSAGFGGGSLDPTSADRFLIPIRILYERLVRPDKNGKPGPGLAESWTSDITGQQFTFILRQNVRFHDGKPFTARDVIYTFKHILDPDRKSPAAAALKLVDAEAFEMPDDYTVIFHLTSPHADFPVLLMHYMVRIIPEGSAETIATSGIGTGPFKLQRLDAQGTTVLVANGEYWREKPKLKRIEIMSVADDSVQGYALLDGRIDYVDGMPPSLVSLFRKRPEFVVQEIPTGSWNTLVMNIAESPFDDIRVREAVKRVVDRQKIVELVLGGSGTAAYDHPVWPGDPYFLQLDREQDIEKARGLLVEAGYPEGFAVDLFVADVNPFAVPLAVAYKQMAAPAGIRVNIQFVPSEGYWSEYYMKKPFFGSNWMERYADQILNEGFRTGAAWNEAYWNNPDYDTLLDQARKELDPEKRHAIYQEAQRMVAEEGGMIIPFFFNTFRVFRRGFQGIPEDVSDQNLNWAAISVQAPGRE